MMLNLFRLSNKPDHFKPHLVNHSFKIILLDTYLHIFFKNRKEPCCLNVFLFSDRQNSDMIDLIQQELTDKQKLEVNLNVKHGHGSSSHSIMVFSQTSLQEQGTMILIFCCGLFWRAQFFPVLSKKITRQFLWYFFGHS